MGKDRRNRRDTENDRRNRDGRGSERRRERQRSRSRLRSRTPACSCSRSEDGGVRLRNLEAMELLLRQESHSSEASPTDVRVAVKVTTSPNFFPGKPNQSSAKWVNKIDQLATVNRRKYYDSVHAKSSNGSRSYLTTYTYTWEEWKALLVRTFPDHHDFASTLRQLVDRVKQPNETMTQYYFGNMNLLQACNITDKEAVSCLIDGLTDRILQYGAKAGRYETPESLYTEYLPTLAAETVEPQDMRPRPRVEHKGLGPRLGAKPTNTNVLTDTLVRHDLRCFNYHEPGHISSKCPKPRLECINCKMLGHDERHCRRIKTTRPVVQLVCPSNTQQCYFIDCILNGKPVRGYIDTGCSIVTPTSRGRGAAAQTTADHAVY
jgi:hypothetical protein